MKVQQVNIDYQKFIEHNFKIKNKEGRVVPFILWNTQDKYKVDLVKTYGKEMENIRDIILKARKEGFSSLVLAMFSTDFLIADYPIASASVADTKDETKKLFNRAKFFLN